VTEQVPEARVQLVGVNVPVELLVKLTVPAGVVPPAPLESATVAVQFVCWFTFTELGVQLTVVDVVLRAPVTVEAALVLPA
jgi:hypothetical protein